MKKQKRILFDDKNNFHFYYVWSVKNPKAWVHIIHGMSEHAARYDKLASDLNKEDIIVTAGDHRGHGAPGREMNSLFHFSDSDGWSKIIKDQIDLISEQNIGCPLILLGHSLGSYMALNVLQQIEKLKTDVRVSGLVLSGSGYESKWLYRINKLIAKIEIYRCGSRASSNILQKLSFESFNDNFSPTRTGSDWLSRDEHQVDKYIKDPLCGGAPSTKTWFDFMHGMNQIFNSRNLNLIDKKVPIHFISGDKDPVGKNGKGVVKFKNLLLDAGFKQVTLKLYPESRHELINDLDRDKVIADVKIWLKAILN